MGPAATFLKEQQMTHFSKKTNRWSLQAALQSRLRKLFLGIAESQGRGIRKQPILLGRSLQVHPVLESLEERSLMAVMAATSNEMPTADSSVVLMPAATPTGPRHNAIDAEDVNDDGECSANDVLMTARNP